MTTQEVSSEESGDGSGRKPDYYDRVLERNQKRNVRDMIARGHAPIGYRINEDRTGFVRIGNPAWPVRPLDPWCSQYGEPSPELMVLIRELIPNFDPERDRRGWLDVAELVLRMGRPADEVRSMGHDELVAFFRCEVSDHQRNGLVAGDGRQAGAVKPASSPTTATPSMAAEQGTTPDKSTSEILREWLDDPERKLKLVATSSSEKAGQLIGRSGSSVREAGDAWKELKAEFKAYRALRRYELERRRQ